MNRKKVLLCESSSVESMKKPIVFAFGSLMLFVFAMMLMSITSSAQARSLPDFTKLVEKHSAAVVNISTTQKIEHPKISRMPRGIPEQIPEGPFGDLFRHFFGDPGRGIPRENATRIANAPARIPKSVSAAKRGEATS